MTGWRWSWFRAQITGALFSTLVWILVWGTSLPALAGVIAAGVLHVTVRNTPIGLWWRYGARPATALERTRVLAALVPIASLRGRGQPTLWIGTRLAGRHAVAPTKRDLIISQQLLGRILAGTLTDDQACAIASHALGQQAVDSSALVVTVDTYCLPWAVVALLVDGFNQVAVRTPLLRFSWKIRWIVFAVAIIDSYLNSRWAALIGVTAIAMLSWTTGYLRAKWASVLQTMGDRRVVAEGLGPVLAAMIRRAGSSNAALQRAARLDHDGTQAHHLSRGSVPAWVRIEPPGAGSGSGLPS